MAKKISVFGKGVSYALAGLFLFGLEIMAIGYTALVVRSLWEDFKNPSVWLAFVAIGCADVLIWWLIKNLWYETKYQFSWLYLTAEKIEVFFDNIDYRKVLWVLIVILVIMGFVLFSQLPTPFQYQSSTSSIHDPSRVPESVSQIKVTISNPSIIFVPANNVDLNPTRFVSVTYGIEDAELVAVRADEIVEDNIDFTGIYLIDGWDKLIALGAVTEEDQNWIIVLDSRGNKVDALQVSDEVTQIDDVSDYKIAGNGTISFHMGERGYVRWVDTQVIEELTYP